jgi:septum formation protein
MKDYQIILASKSPRRKELLAHLIPKFEIKLKEIEEVYPTSLQADEVSEYLAKLKADAFTEDLKNNELLITSDTIVTLNNKIYGKPRNREHAIEILLALSGNAHEVITGVCLMHKDRYLTFKETTKVYFKALSQAEIEFYIDNYQPYDKAGAYAIQEWIGMVGIEKIEGDYFNVVGLPLFKLNEALNSF